MFQKVKQMCRKAKGFIQGVSTKVKMLALTLFSGTTAMAQSTAGDYSAGTTALSTVAEEIVKYVPVMVKLCCCCHFRRLFNSLSFTQSADKRRVKTISGSGCIYRLNSVNSCFNRFFLRINL